MGTLITEYWNNTVAWAAVITVLLIVVLLIFKKLAEQPFFGGPKQQDPLDEHYLHGEMTTEEYEDLKSHRQGKSKALGG
jgi:uncharacterized membrane protein